MLFPMRPSSPRIWRRALWSAGGRRWARGPAWPRAGARMKAATASPALSALAARALNSSSVHRTRDWRMRRRLSLPAMTLPFTLACAENSCPVQGRHEPRSGPADGWSNPGGLLLVWVQGVRKPLVRSRRNGLVVSLGGAALGLSGHAEEARGYWKNTLLWVMQRGRK